MGDGGRERICRISAVGNGAGTFMRQDDSGGSGKMPQDSLFSFLLQSRAHQLQQHGLY